MALPKQRAEYPIKFVPKGLSDAYDASEKFPGACLTLSNLIFDQANPEIVVSRPGVGDPTYEFGDFSMPDVVSVEIAIGMVVYGMISTARNSGKDEPFAYDISAGAFISISGVTNANTPATQSTTGAWTPPTMAVIGTSIIVTHPGFSATAFKVGRIDISNPAAPAWSASVVAANDLPTIPLWVANFNNRAYYGCGQVVPYSDVLVPLTRTNASQALTVGDTTSVLAASGLPVQTTSSGVIAALILFKSFQVWQVTGDAATSNLALNYISLTTGSSAPRSIAQSPQGLYFHATSGPWVIDPLGVLRPLTFSGREQEPDINIPWQNATTPSRIAAGYSNSVYRICMETTVRGVTSKNDYWFDEHKRRWNGPHSFNYDCAAPVGNYFVIVSNDVPAKLFSSEVTPSISSSYSDDGTALTSTLQSATFPKTNHMATKQVIEATQELANGGSPTAYNVQALDQVGNTLNSINMNVPAAGTLWGTGMWGAFNWASSRSIPFVWTVPWTIPLVFKKMALYMTGTSASSLSIGAHYARYQDCGYLNTQDFSS